MPICRAGEARWIVCVDDARFLNHSDTPNVLGDEWISTAAIDLPPRTELTLDYRSFDRLPITF